MKRIVKMVVLAAVVPAFGATAAGASSPWLPAPGEIQVRGKSLRQSSSSAYCPILSRGEPIEACGRDGERADYPSNGEARSTTWLLEAEAGLHRRLSADVKISYQSLDFDNLESGNITAPPILNNISSRGFGDLSLGARAALLQGAVRLTPYASFKFPLMDSIPATMSQAFPLDERQIDSEFGVHAGLSLWPRPAYLRARGGFRARSENDRTRRDPGNEVFADFEAGVRLGAVLLKTGIDWLDAGETKITDVAGDESSEPGKRIVRIAPGIAVDILPRLGVDAALYVPVAGENYPAGTTVAVGLSTRITFPPPPTQ